MRTKIQIDNGQNIIDILFDDFASCLVVKKALAVNWPDCRGSVGEYYAISDYSTEERNSYTKTINNALSEGTDAEQFEIIKSFLNLFANGEYEICKYIAKIMDVDFLASNMVGYSDSIPQNERFFGSFYPSYKSNSEPLLFSITNDKIDQNRVEHYCELIRKGLKPTVLAFEVWNSLIHDHSCKYVLDGHHKIAAYLKLKVDIPVINIVKLEESIKKTAPLLHHAKTILKDFEYRHLFENNDENLLSIDFVNDGDLTDDLDKILKNSNRIDVSLINVLKKHYNEGTDLETSWLENRLNKLKQNPNISFFGLGKGLQVYEKKKDEKYGECWFPKKVNTNIQLNNWINKTIK